jgi:hypothetical protein
VPIAVRNIDAAAAQFERLGFTLKPGRYHSDGIVNRHAKFPDGTELELITARATGSELAAAYRDHLRSGDGPAYLALYVPDLGSVAAWLRDAGEAFTQTRRFLSLEEESDLSYLFFAPLGDGSGLNRSPTDRPIHFRHENGAIRLTDVWLAGGDFARERSLLARLGAALRREPACVPQLVPAEVADLAGSRLLLLPAGMQRVAGRPIVGVTVSVRDVAVTRALLRQRGIRFVDRSPRGSLYVPPDLAGGTWVEFRQAGAAGDHSYWSACAGRARAAR